MTCNRGAAKVPQPPNGASINGCGSTVYYNERCRALKIYRDPRAKSQVNIAIIAAGTDNTATAVGRYFWMCLRPAAHAVCDRLYDLSSLFLPWALATRCGNYADIRTSW